MAFTSWTHTGLKGSVFRNPCVFEFPDTLEYLRTNADGTNQGIEQIAKDVVDSVLGVGKVGLFVDFPEDASKGNAKIKLYECEDILDWHMGVHNGEYKLVFVKLKETHINATDLLNREEVEKIRTLNLNDNGYYQELYDADDGSKKETFLVKGYNGEKIEEVPFYFAGAKNNRPGFDKPPFLDIAYINLGHYRNSADYEENNHYHGQGTLFISSKLSKQQWDDANPDGVRVGARSAHHLGDGGRAELLQLAPAQTLEEAMNNKIKQMVALGARYIEESKGNVVVDAVNSNIAQKESGLSTLVGNCEAALLNALRFVTVFMSGDPEQITAQLNRDFFGKNVNYQDITAGIMLVDSQVIAKSDLREYLRRADKFIKHDRTDEEIDAEAESGLINVE